MPRYFTKEHEWIRVEGDTATVGITNHAQHQLGDIVFAEAPEAGEGEPPLSPAILGTCHAYAPDSPVVRRRKG